MLNSTLYFQSAYSVQIGASQVVPSTYREGKLRGESSIKSSEMQRNSPPNPGLPRIKQHKCQEEGTVCRRTPVRGGTTVGSWSSETQIVRSPHPEVNEEGKREELMS